jgi:quercetin dioxygenase-like cupin family protein
MTDEPGLFLAQVDDAPWESAAPLGLPPGVVWRPYELTDEGDGAILVKFPPGYVEPRHVHEAEHFDVIIEGEMHVDGKVLCRGDYLHGFPNKPHGPMAYPKGCTVFAVMRGGVESFRHDYDASEPNIGEGGVAT